MSKYVLVIDCGTQSIRAMIFDELGKIIGKEKKEFAPYYSKKPGWAEQKPIVWWEGLCEVSKKLKEKYSQIWQEILSVTVTTSL